VLFSGWDYHDFECLILNQIIRFGWNFQSIFAYELIPSNSVFEAQINKDNAITSVQGNAHYVKACS